MANEQTNVANRRTGYHLTKGNDLTDTVRRRVVIIEIRPSQSYIIRILERKIWS